LRRFVFAILFLILLTGGVGQLWYWLLWPQTPLVINKPIHVEKVQIFGGSDTVVYSMDYCKPYKFLNIQAEVHYSLVNHDGIFHELPGMSVTSLPPGCHSILVAVPIPQVDPGIYTLNMLRVYQVNPLRKVEVSSVSAPFEIR
jgi:hypothetical protein